MLVALPLALFVYLRLQSRYFGRWLLPAYPALAMLAAVALVRVVRAAAGRPRGQRAPRPPALAAVVLAQPVAADVRTASCSAARTRASRRATGSSPTTRRSCASSIEPAVPGRYFRSNPERAHPALARPLPAPRAAGPSPAGPIRGTDGRRVCDRYKPGQFARPDGGVRASAYHCVLGPTVIDDYRLYGYCLVMTLNVVRERALETGDPRWRAYYRRLARESTLVREFSPYERGANPCRSTSTSPTTTTRPPTSGRGRRSASTGCDDCRQAYGPPLIRIPKAREVPPDVAPDQF